MNGDTVSGHGWILAGDPIIYEYLRETDSGYVCDACGACTNLSFGKPLHTCPTAQRARRERDYLLGYEAALRGEPKPGLPVSPAVTHTGK